MDYCKAIKGLIDSKKWVRNDMGVAKAQFLKLILVKEKLMLLIISNNISEPLYAKVENVMIINEQITVFYDGEYCITLKEEEYESFKENVTKEEWNVLFHGDVTKDLDELGLLEKEKGFFAELHNNTEQFMKANVDRKASEEICSEYGIK